MVILFVKPLPAEKNVHHCMLLRFIEPWLKNKLLIIKQEAVRIIRREKRECNLVAMM